MSLTIPMPKRRAATAEMAGRAKLRAAQLSSSFMCCWVASPNCNSSSTLLMGIRSA